MYKNYDLKIVVIIEARMGSSRLPGKVLFPLIEKPVLQHIIERINRSKYIDEIVVATTENVLDDKIVEFCLNFDYKYYRGSEDDVLLRVLNTAKSAQADIIVEICGDCPVIDWRHIDKSIELYFSGDYDYISNDVEKTFPIGLRVQVYPVSILERINQLTDSEADHEHVTLYIYSNPNKFKILNWCAEGDMIHPELEITLDTAEDYELIKFLFNQLYPNDNDFTALDVVKLFLNNPEINNYTKDVKRKDAFLEKKEEENKKNSNI